MHGRMSGWLIAVSLALLTIALPAGAEPTLDSDYVLIVPAQATDLAGHRLDLGPHLVALGRQRTLALVEVPHLLELGQVVTPAGEVRRHAVVVGAHAPQVDHGPKP